MATILGYIGLDDTHVHMKDSYDCIILFPTAHIARLRGATTVKKVVKASRVTQIEKRAVIAMVTNAAKLSHEDITSLWHRVQ